MSEPYWATGCVTQVGKPRGWGLISPGLWSQPEVPASMSEIMGAMWALASSQPASQRPISQRSRSVPDKTRISGTEVVLFTDNVLQEQYGAFIEQGSGLPGQHLLLGVFQPHGLFFLSLLLWLFCLHPEGREQECTDVCLFRLFTPSFTSSSSLALKTIYTLLYVLKQIISLPSLPSPRLVISTAHLTSLLGYISGIANIKHPRQTPPVPSTLDPFLPWCSPAECGYAPSTY